MSCLDLKSTGGITAWKQCVGDLIMFKKLALVCTIALVASFAFSQTLEMGTRELILNGNMDFDDEAGNANWSIDAALGYFVADNVEVGPMVRVEYDGDDMGYGLGALAEYNIDLEMALVPFVAVRGHYMFGDAFEDNYVLGEGALGAKVFLSDAVAVSAEVFYYLASEDVFFNNGKWEDDDAGINLGVRCFF